MKEWIICLNGWRGPDPLRKSWMPVQADKLTFNNGHLLFLTLGDEIIRAVAPGHWAMVVTQEEFERIHNAQIQYAVAT